MAVDIATLQLEIKTNGAQKASDVLAKLEAQSKKTEGATTQMGNEAQKVYEKTRTAAERYEREIAQLNAMRKAGAISEDTHKRAIKQAGDEMDRAKSKGTALGNSLRGLGSVLGMVFSVATAGQILAIADKMNVMESQLKSVTQAGDSYKGVYSQLLEIANRNQTAMGSTADLYTKTARAMQPLGATTSQLMSFTDNLSRTMKAAGLSAEDQSGAILQLSQAMGSGRLQGDEFRSIMERAPTVMQALADSMGVPIGQLKKLGSEGAITSDKIFSAFQTLPESVKKIAVPASVSGSWTVLTNNIQDYIHRADKATGVTGIFAGIINTMANNLDVIVPIIGVGLVGALGLMSIGLVNMTGELVLATAAQWGLNIAMGANPIGLIVLAIGAAIAAIVALIVKWDAVKQAFDDNPILNALFPIIPIIRGIGDAFDYIKPKAEDTFGAIGIMADDFANMSIWDDIANSADSTWENIKSSASSMWDDLMSWGSNAIDAISSYIPSLSDVWGVVWGNIQNIAGAVGSALVGILGQDTVNAITAGFTAMYSAVSSMLSGLLSFANKVISYVSSAYSQAQTNSAAANYGRQEGFSGSAMGVSGVNSQATMPKTPSAGAMPKLGGAGGGGKKGGGGGGKKGGGGGGGSGKNTAQQAIDDYKRMIEDFENKIADVKGNTKEFSDFGAKSIYTAVEKFDAGITKLKEKLKGMKPEALSKAIADLRAKANELDQAKMQESVAKFGFDIKSKLDDMAYENTLIGKTADEIDRMRYARELDNQVLRLSVGMSPEYVAQLKVQADVAKSRFDDIQAAKDKIEAQEKGDWMAGISKGFDEWINKASDFAGIMQSSVGSTLDSISNAFGDLVTKGKADFKSLTASILSDLAKIMMKKAIAGIGSSIMGGLGFSFMAKGGAYDNGIQAFANGGTFTNSIVDSPTLFKFANGTGLMGEAGAEAIMPLSRDSKGRLGVTVNGGQQAGGGVTVTTVVNINQNGESDSKTTTAGTNAQQGKQLGEMIRAVVMETIVTQKRNGGLFA